MPPLPILKPKELVKILEKMGYRQHRQKGSHLIMIKDGTICQPVIPVHNKELKRGTLKAIIRQIRLTTEEFMEFL